MCNPEIDPLLLIDDDVIAELRDVMEEEFADLIHNFLSEVPLQFNLLQAAIDLKDADQIYQVAHKFKSSCGSIGAPRLAGHMQVLEQAGRLKNLDGAAELLASARRVATETITSLHNRLV